MADDREPISAAVDDDRDLYEIASWEARTRLDRFSIWLVAWLGRLGRGLVVLVALGILIAQFVFSGLAAISDPSVGLFILLSVLPAVVIVGLLWQADVTSREPLSTLVVTFLLGVLFAGFAAVLNTIADPLFSAVPFVGLLAFSFLVVAPVEETVKLLAVRLYAFRRPVFGAVIDGAVYGAVAGLGFATIENTVYIGQGYLAASQAGTGAIAATIETAAVRTVVGPGHVIYSAFVGYYLGLAKFNRDQAGPIVVKGLLIGSLAHGAYNTLVGIVPNIVAELTGLIWPVTFIAFVVIYDGTLAYLLYRKIARYRRMYRDTVESARIRRVVHPQADTQRSWSNSEKMDRDEYPSLEPMSRPREVEEEPESNQENDDSGSE